MSYKDSISMVFSGRSIVAYSLILKQHFQDGGQDGRHKNLILTNLCSAIRYKGKESVHAVIV